jgi:hypothetical protein
MARVLSFVLAGSAAAAATLGGAGPASACGANGYSYAGLAAPQRAFGISAMVTSVDNFAVLHGHVAGWVGVGGPGEGPGGTNEWLQVGLSSFPGVVGSDIYYEVALPGRYPVYHQVASSLPAGTAVAVTVLQMRDHRDRWRVSLNGQAVSPPIRLPRSHGRWTPMATAESWDGGTGGACNAFLYDFRRLEVAHAAGGSWHPLSGGFPIESRMTRIRRARDGAAFLAAEGRAAFEFLLSLTP